MRLLFYIHSLRAGGAERATAAIANELTRRGCTVTVVTNAGSDDDFYSLDTAIERRTLNAEAVSRNLAGAVYGNIRRIWLLRQAMFAFRPTAAIAMMTTANCVLAFAGSGLGVRLVGSERVHPPAYPLSRLWQGIRRIAYPRLHSVVAQTKRSGDWLESNVAGAHVVVIPNPVQIPLPVREPVLDPSTIKPARSDRRMLLAVGRLDRQKGFDQLIPAFASAVRSADNWVLLILGEGPCRQSLETLVGSLGLEGRVLMPGAVGNVGEWYESADLFVLSSRFEGFPNCLLEAMAYGVATVAADCETGPGEIIHDDVDGVLVPAGDRDELSAALERLMNAEAERVRLAEQGRRVSDRYSISRIGEEWMKVLGGEGNDD